MNLQLNVGKGMIQYPMHKDSLSIHEHLMNF